MTLSRTTRTSTLRAISCSAGGFATPGLVNTTTYQFSDDFSLIKGSHQMQFGVNYIRPMQATTFCVYCNGLFTFNGNLTGNAMADFISGSLDSFTQLNISHDNEKWQYLGTLRARQLEGDFPPDVNYGLRWEPYLNGRLLNNQVSHFVMSDFLAQRSFHGVPERAGRHTVPGRCRVQHGQPAQLHHAGTILRRVWVWRGILKATAKR